MKHAASRELYAYWEQAARPRARRLNAPRSSPAQSARCSANLHSRSWTMTRRHPFRLAGTRVCALFGRELKGESFVDLWAPASRPPSSICSPFSRTKASARSPARPRTTTTASRSNSSFCCCRSAPAGPASRAPSAFWRRSKFRNGLAHSPIGALTLGSRRHVGATTQSRLAAAFHGGAPRRGSWSMTAAAPSAHRVRDTTVRNLCNGG